MTDSPPVQYVTASSEQKAAFLKILDCRFDEFIQWVHKNDDDSDAILAAESWVAETRERLTTLFSSWYRDNIEGSRIPADLVIPTTPGDDRSRVLSKYFSDPSCEVCGTRRALNIAHIIPRVADGPDEGWNLLCLCANHHYLFDQNQLTREEWDSVLWDAKDRRALEHLNDYQLPAHKKYWRESQ